MSEPNKDALAAAVEAWNAGHGERYLQLYDASIVHHGPAPEPLDQEANQAFYEELWAAFPGAQLAIDDTVAEGDKLAIRFRLTGEHKGDYRGIPPTGRPFVLNGQTILRYQDGRVVERWTTADLLGLLTQLGAIPAPGQ
jgi:steroid delta-isomerase-like uncharacterized protein